MAPKHRSSDTGYSAFKQRVLSVIRMVPYGKVASYGQIALFVGVPRAARQVGWILNQTEGTLDIPWWRIVNNAGRLSIKGTKYNDKEVMRKLLLAEGVEVSDDYTFDIEKHRFRPDPKMLKDMALSDAYIEQLIEKYHL